MRQIFERYLAGATPRQIAGHLNDDRVLPPRGGDTWRASTINNGTLTCQWDFAERDLHGGHYLRSAEDDA